MIRIVEGVHLTLNILYVGNKLVGIFMFLYLS